MSKHHLTRLSQNLSFRIDLNELELIRWHEGSIEVYFNGSSYVVSGTDAEVLNGIMAVPDHSFIKLSDQLALNVSKIQVIEWQREPLSAKVIFCDASKVTLAKGEAEELKKLIGHHFDGEAEPSLGKILHGD